MAAARRPRAPAVLTRRRPQGPRYRILSPEDTVTGSRANNAEQRARIRLRIAPVLIDRSSVIGKCIIEMQGIAGC